MKRMPGRPEHGFTLLELVMTLAVFGVLAMLAVPQFSTWTQSAKVRSVSESLQNDLRLARGEAMRQNRQVLFSLINSPGTTSPVIFTSNSAGTTTNPSTSFTVQTTGTNWMAYTSPILTGEPYSYVAGGDNGNLESPVQVAGTLAGGTASGTITFSPFGRLVNQTSIQWFDITRPSSSARNLRVTVTPGGQIRLCDPNRNITNAPDGC